MKTVLTELFRNPARVALAAVITSMSPAIVFAQAVFINDGTIYTMSSQSTMQNADLLIRDGVVRAIGNELTAPADATVIEANGRPVTPGFFAGITNIGLQDIPMEKNTVDAGLNLQSMHPEFDVTPAYNPDSTLVPITRIEGFSWTVLGANRAGNFVGGLGRGVLFDGGYESFAGDSVLFIDIGSDASEQSGGSRAAQWMLLNRAMQEATSEDVQWSPDTVLTLAGREALRDVSTQGTIVFDADRASDILQVIRFSQQHELRAVLRGGAEAWKVADELAEAGIPVLLNPLENLPRSFDQLGARLDNAALLHAAGVTVSYHTDESNNARKIRQVAGNAVANGLPYETALAGLTRSPAQIFGMGELAGTLQEDSPADIVIWSGDPLEVTSAADQVIIGGQIIPMVSRQTLLRDRYLPENPEVSRVYIKP